MVDINPVRVSKHSRSQCLLAILQLSSHLNVKINDLPGPINLYKLDEIDEFMAKIPKKPLYVVMIHEQYFFPFYEAYQPDYEEKLRKVFTILENRGAKSVLLHEITK